MLLSFCFFFPFKLNPSSSHHQPPLPTTHTHTPFEAKLSCCPNIVQSFGEKKRKGCDPDWFFFVSRWEANALLHLSTTARARRQTLCVTLFGRILWRVTFKTKQNSPSCEKKSNCKKFYLHTKKNQTYLKLFNTATYVQLLPEHSVF